MTDRERLIELLEDIAHEKGGMPTFSEIADYLLANGVILLPVEIGQTVYELRCDDPFSEEMNFYIVSSAVKKFAFFTTEDIHAMNGVGKTVFLTKEEAEEKLRERNTKND